MGRFIISCLRLMGFCFSLMGRLAGLLKKSIVQNVQEMVSEVDGECHLGSCEIVLSPGKREAASNSTL
jgi:hypothetical protein